MLRTIAHASGLELPRAPLIRVKEPIHHHTHWDGVIVGRAWPQEMTDLDYYTMICGGNRKHALHPDRYTADGAPVYDVTAYEARQARKLMDRLCLDGYETHNAACTIGRTMILNFIGNVNGQVGVKYFAVGTGSGTPNAGDSVLFFEAFRKQVTTVSGASTGQLLLNTVFNTTEGNFSYTEAGVFGGSATGTSGSGTLYAHAAYSYVKSSSVQLSNSYYITLS